jgi:hypothetical protein
MTGGQRELHREKPVVWFKTMMRVQLAAGEKLVLVDLALNYADKRDGHGARPGLSRLEYDTGVTRKTVVSALLNAEKMGLLYVAERGSRGRGHASTYDLTLHDEVSRYFGPTFADWVADRRPADRKGVQGHLIETLMSPSGKGVQGHLSEPLKGVRDDAKRCPSAPEKVSYDTAPGGTPGKSNQFSASHWLDASRRAAEFLGRFAAENLSEWEVSDALEEILQPTEYEQSAIDGMLSNGSHPAAVINKIEADRRRYA